MKGQNEQQQLLEAIAYLHGRFELEAEYFCFNKGLDPLAVTPLVGARLVGASMDNMSAVLQKARPAHSPASAMEVAHRAHGRGTQTATKRGSRKTAKNQMNSQQKYWAKFTPEERRREMLRRQRKWKPSSLKKWRSGGKIRWRRKKLPQPVAQAA